MATIPRLGGTVGARLAAMTTSGRTTPALRRLRATVSVVLLLVGVASACSGGGSEEGSARGGNPTDSAATPSSSATPTGTPSTGCGTLPATESVEAPPGDAVVTLGDRSYRLGIPADYDRDRPVPLVMNLHGSGSNALEQTTYSEMAARAGERGWITVTPDAIGGKWELAPTGADDEFLTAVFDQVTAGYCVDLDRVHLTGMSLGAWKAAATACAHADRFASIALVTVEVHPSDCPPMSVVAFHGTADTVVPYGEGADPGVVVTGPNAGLPGARGNMAGWASAAGCGAEPQVQQIGSDVEHWTYPGCPDGRGVELYSIEGGGHTWPGASIDIGPTTQTIDSTDIALDWFETHPRA